MDLTALLAICLGTFAVVSSQASAIVKNLPKTLPQLGYIDSRFWINTDIDPIVGESFLKRVSSSPSHFLRLKADSSPLLPANEQPYDLRYLRTFPLVDVGDGRYFVPSIDLVVDRFTTRVVFDIFDELDDRGKKEFGAYFGSLAENYAHEILQSSLGEPGISTGIWYKPSQYESLGDAGEGPDAIVLVQQEAAIDAMFFEVKSSRPNNIGLIQGDMSRLRQSWQRDLIGTPSNKKGARQLDRAITNFRSGLLNIPGIDQRMIRNIKPIIVTVDTWPFWLEVYDLCVEDVKENDLLLQNNVEPLEILSMYDLEMLAAYVANGRTIRSAFYNRMYGKGEYFPLSIHVERNNRPILSILTQSIWTRMRNALVSGINLRDPV